MAGGDRTLLGRMGIAEPGWKTAGVRLVVRPHFPANE